MVPVKTVPRASDVVAEVKSIGIGLKASVVGALVVAQGEAKAR